jgi:glycosyltransferase 2 family protein
MAAISARSATGSLLAVAIRKRPVAVEPVTVPGPVVRDWRSLVFAPLGDGQRRRRGSDGIRLAVAVLATLCAVLAVQSNSRPEQVIADVLNPPPDGMRWLINVFWIGGSFGTVAVLLLLAAIRRRWDVLRDLAIAAGGALAVSGILVLILGAAGGRPHTVYFAGYNLSFPVLHVAVAVGVATVGLPYLARGVQRLIESVLALAILATVVAGQGLPANVVGSMAIGWGVTAALHLALGSPVGLPSGEEVRALLGTVGLEPTSVVPAPHQTWGAAHYLADMGDGEALAVSFYGRDATDAQLITKLWRFVFYRHSGAALALTRIQQVEHESSITQLAARAGARVPEVLIASTLGPSRDAVVITRAPAGQPLAALDHQQVTDAHLDDLFAQMMKLRSAAISHGAVSPQTIVVDPDQETATLVDFRNGTSAATAFVLDQDLAGAMASAALAAGSRRTAASVVRVVPSGLLSGALGHLRRAGLDPAVNLGLRGKKDLLDELRTSTALAADISVPELAEPRRMSWNQVLVAAGTLIGGWALILTLINAAHSINTIRSADWGWVVATFILCASGYFGSACSDLGSVPGSVAYGRAVGLQVASAFTSLAGGEAAVVATNVRFFQQQGYDTAVAVTSGALVGAANWIVKAALFLIAIPLAWSSFHFGNSLHQGAHSKILVLILVVVCVFGAVMAIVLAVPRLRRQVTGKLRPKFATVRENLTQLASQPSKIAQLFGGQVAAQLAVVLALGAALHAFGAYLSLAALIIAVTMAGVLASASPAGGGMGVAEAGLILALTAGGIAKNDATAAVFVQRLFSAYLPPIAGWFALMWMRRREYL